MRVPMDQLTDGARIWVFGSAEPLTDGVREMLSIELDRFLDQWTSHNVPVRAAADVVDGRFVVVAAGDETDMGGCSIDRLFRLLGEIDAHAATRFLDSSLVFFEGPEGIRAVSRQELRSLIDSGEVDGETTVCDLTVETLGDFRNRFRLRAADSWHGAAFGLQAPTTV